MQLELNKIRLDGATQPRAKLQTDVIDEYAEQMRDGVAFPPITVFFDGREYWLADGFHRLDAWLQVHPGESIEADVTQGTQSDAQWYSYGVNKSHGLQRTREDRVRAIKAALRHPEGAKRADNDIAKHVGVSPSTVGKYRAQIETTFQIGKSSGQAGTSRKMPSPGPETPESRPAQQPVELPAPKSAAARHRKGRDGRTINTAKIGTARKNKPDRGRGSPAKPSRHMASRIHQPTRAPSLLEKMTTVTLPHNPVMGARTLIEVFDVDYLRALVTELSNHLKGAES